MRKIFFTLIVVINRNVNVSGYFKGLPEMEEELVKSFNENVGERNGVEQ